MKKKTAVPRSLLITGGVFLLTALIVSFSIKDPTFGNLKEEAEFEEKTNRPELAELSRFKIMRADSLDLAKHRDYINAHFAIPKSTNTGSSNTERDDATIGKYYYQLSESMHGPTADIGNYCAGFIYSKIDEYKSALVCFKRVKNTELKYLNSSLGYAYWSLDSIRQAEFYFKKEIANKGNLDGACYNLISMLYEKGRIDEVKELLKRDDLTDYFPNKIKRDIYFKEGKLFAYFGLIFHSLISNLNLLGFLAAFLIMGSWVMYLRKLDIYEAEDWKNIFLVTAMGMVSCFLVFPLSDLNNLILGFKLNGALVNDFLYCFGGIGAVEELAKILPLLLILRFTKIVNEPYDYILYASLSAMGFAFVENLLYFDNNSLHVIHGRALMSAVSHMFDSSIIAYGLLLQKYKRQWNPYLNFLLFFCLAALAHGFYDFWLINEKASSFSMLTVIFLLASIYMWNSFKNNALNNSNFFDKTKLIDSEKLQDYLLYSLAGILLFEYVAIAIEFGHSIANANLYSSLISGAYMIAFFSGNLSKFSLNRGEWAPIRYSNRQEKVDYGKIIDSPIKIKRLTQNSKAYSMLPCSGKIYDRILVSGQPDWYLIKLDEPKEIEGYLKDTVLISTKEENEITLGENQVIAFFIIPEGTDLQSLALKRTDFVFCGWAIAE